MRGMEADWLFRKVSIVFQRASNVRFLHEYFGRKYHVLQSNNRAGLRRTDWWAQHIIDTLRHKVGELGAEESSGLGTAAERSKR